jgi:hypothetical protein
MRLENVRVHIPLRFLTLLQCWDWERKGLAGSAWDAYKIGLQSSRNVFKYVGDACGLYCIPGKIIWGDTDFVKLQSTAVPGEKLFFSVVGWHALTLPQIPKLLSEARTTTMALMLASGIDPQRSAVFHQDEVTDSHRAVSRISIDVSNRSRTMSNSLGF